MYWEEYDLTLEVGDVIIYKYVSHGSGFDNNREYRICLIIGNIFRLFQINITNKFEKFDVLHEEHRCTSKNKAFLNNFKPSAQLLRKHKLKKLLNEL